MTVLHEKVLAALQAELPRAITLRHALHGAPDVSGSEQVTLSRVVAELSSSAMTETLDRSAAVARIGALGGPAVAIRAELDALPIVESSGYRWASANGAMHACGHDVHLAALVATSRVVESLGAPLPLLAVLQPREEAYPSGARDLLASGALPTEDGGVLTIVGAHVHPDLGVGEVACDAGVVNASSDEFRVEFTGRAGHAAYPHLNTDPVLALADFVMSVQQVVSRNADPMVPSVVTVGAVRAGAVANATPRTADALGTIRAMDRDQRDLVVAAVRRVAQGVAVTHECTVDIDFTAGEPALTNDAQLAAATVTELAGLGLHRARPMRSCGSDDFAYYGAVAPSLMMFAGVEKYSGHQLHAPDFVPADSAVATIALAMLAGYLATVTTHGPADLAEPGVRAASRGT